MKKRIDNYPNLKEYKERLDKLAAVILIGYMEGSKPPPYEEKIMIINSVACARMIIDQVDKQVNQELAETGYEMGVR